MAKTLRLLALTGLAVGVAGCFVKKDPPVEIKQPEIVYVDPAPITVEPVFEGKYGHH